MHSINRYPSETMRDVPPRAPVLLSMIHTVGKFGTLAYTYGTMMARSRGLGLQESVYQPCCHESRPWRDGKDDWQDDFILADTSISTPSMVPCFVVSTFLGWNWNICGVVPLSFYSVLPVADQPRVCSFCSISCYCIIPLSQERRYNHLYSYLMNQFQAQSKTPSQCIFPIRNVKQEAMDQSFLRCPDFLLSPGDCCQLLHTLDYPITPLSLEPWISGPGQPPPAALCQDTSLRSWKEMV